MARKQSARPVKAQAQAQAPDILRLTALQGTTLDDHTVTQARDLLTQGLRWVKDTDEGREAALAWLDAYCTVISGDAETAATETAQETALAAERAAERAAQAAQARALIVRAREAAVEGYLAWGLSQKDIAARMGLTQGRVSQVAARLKVKAALHQGRKALGADVADSKGVRLTPAEVSHLSEKVSGTARKEAMSDLQAGRVPSVIADLRAGADKPQAARVAALLEKVQAALDKGTPGAEWEAVAAQAARVAARTQALAEIQVKARKSA